MLYYIIAACLSLSIPHKPPGSDNLLSWFALICDGGVQGAEGYTRRERPHCFNFFENLDSVLTGRLEIIYVQPGQRALVKCGLREESCIRHSVKWSDFSLAFSVQAAIFDLFIGSTLTELHFFVKTGCELLSCDKLTVCGVCVSVSICFLVNIEFLWNTLFCKLFCF